MEMITKTLVWETVRENAMRDLRGRKTQNNKVISNESHNEIASSKTSDALTKLFGGTKRVRPFIHFLTSSQLRLLFRFNAQDIFPHAICFNKVTVERNVTQANVI
jgi:hypothetical protein